MHLHVLCLLWLSLIVDLSLANQLMAHLFEFQVKGWFPALQDNHGTQDNWAQSQLFSGDTIRCCEANEFHIYFCCYKRLTVRQLQKSSVRSSSLILVQF
jgi:hypothetical protein